MIVLINATEEGASRRAGRRERVYIDYKDPVGRGLHAIAQVARDLPESANREPIIGAELVIGEDGIIRLSANNILELIDVDARRIRECEVCGRIFWARQDNMVACENTRCKTNVRKRRQRERDRLLAKRKKP